MSTSTDAVTVPVKLTGQETYTAWDESVSGVAILIDCGFEHGLVHQVLDAHAYGMFPNVVGPFAPPQQPARPAAGAGAGTLQIYKEELTIWLRYQKTSSQLKKAIIDSLSDVLLRDIRDPGINQVIMTTPQIMAHMRNLYGIPHATAITTIKADLLKPLEGIDITTFIDHSSRYRHLVGRLATAQQPLAMFDQMDHFITSCQTQGTVTAAIDRYIQDNPDVQQRTLANLILHVRLQLQNVTALAFGYAQAANGLVNAASMQQVLHHGHDLQQIVDEMRRQGLVIAPVPRQAAVIPRNAGGVRNGPAHAGGAGPVRRPRNMAHYCWHHGYGHLGRECLVMVNNPQQFNKAQLNARNPADVPGGHQ